MAKKTFTLQMLSGILLLGSMSFMGCKQSDLDLDDIDLTIGVTLNDFTLPAVSTREIELDEVLDIDDSDCILADENGQYYFEKAVGEGDVTPAYPKIDPVSFQLSSQSSQSFSYTLTLPSISLAARQGDRHTTGLSGDQEIYQFKFQANHSSDIIRLDSAFVNSQLTLTLSFSELSNVLNQVSEMHIQLPSYLDIDYGLKQGGVNLPAANYTINENTNLLTLNNVNPANGNITLTATIKDLVFNGTQSAADQANNYKLEFTNTQINLSGGILFGLTVSSTDVKQGLSPSALSQSYTISCQSTIGSTITVTAAKGVFKPAGFKLDNVGDVQITDLPDFLDDDDVKLVVKAPVIELDLQSNLDVEGLITDAVITSTNPSKSVAINDITIKPHKQAHSAAVSTDVVTTTKVVICDPGYDASSYTAKGYSVVRTKNGTLRSLLEKIPESITFNCNATATGNLAAPGYVKLGETNYIIKPSFTFRAPLEFVSDNGKVTQIVYRDSLTGWKDDLKDIERLGENTYISIEGDVINQLPFALKVEAGALELDPDDASGESHITMPETDFEVKVLDKKDGSDVTVAAGSEANPVTTHIYIVLKQKNANAFKRLDGLKFKAFATIAEGALKNYQKLKLDNMRATVNGLVVVNGNDKDDDD